jgi:hypothetical protein
VTLKADVRQDRPDVPVEIDLGIRRLGAARRCDQEKAQSNYPPRQTIHHEFSHKRMQQFDYGSP